MKVYLNRNVLEAALARMRWVFDEFPNVVVNFSGGKDSTATLQLALQVAEEKGRLPLPVLFVDQEAEFQSTIDYVRQVMDDPRIRPLWVQVEMRMTNNASVGEMITCWDPKTPDLWMHPKEEGLAITENTFGVDRFYDLFSAVVEQTFDGPIAKLAGVRCEESPARMKGLTTYATYKWATWGKVENKRRQHFTFYPLYDWSTSDIWKAIHDNGWAYNRIYDYQFRYGVPVPNMRVSSLHHETSLPILYYLQEVEPETWEKLTRKVNGANTVGQMRAEFMAPKDLPPMFRDWQEYRDHLLENLIEDPAKRERFRKTFADWDARYEPEAHRDLMRAEIKTILTDDEHGQKLTTFAAANGRYAKRRGSKGGDASDRWDGK